MHDQYHEVEDFADHYFSRFDHRSFSTLSHQSDGEIMARFTGEQFDVVYVNWSGTPVAIIHGDQHNTKTLTVGISFTVEKERGRAYGQRLYRALLDHGYTLLSDLELTKEAMAVWQKIAADPAYQVGLKTGDDPIRAITSANDIEDDYSARYIARKRP